MKTTRILLLLMGLILAGCSKEDDEGGYTSPIIGKWLAISYRAEHNMKEESMDLFKWRGMKNELLLNRNGSFRCSAYPWHPETSGKYQIVDDDVVKFYTSEKALKPEFRGTFVKLLNDTAIVRFRTYDTDEQYYEVTLVRK